MAQPPIWYQMTGIKELDATLEQFPKRLRRKMAKEVLRDAAVPLLNSMQATVPVDSGILKSKLTIKNMRLSKERWRAGWTGATVTVKGKKIRYAYHLETGTSDTAPVPFARTAAKMAKSAVIARFKKGMAKAIYTTAVKVRPPGTK
jgi:HK97 gp10 family phage protein